MTMITRLEVDRKYADIELSDLGYLYLVWDYVLRYYKPKLQMGKKTQDKKQNGFDHVVNLTEKMTSYYWPYKPEVSFSVPQGEGTPVPHLTRNRQAGKKEQQENEHYIEKIGEKISLTDPTTEGKNRRHTRWKGSPAIIAGATVKRPDLIIVNDYKTRWPGRNAAYPPTGENYGDNLKRLVEMKYGKDGLDFEQREAYQQIATPERFAVLKIWQDDNKDDTRHIYEFSPDLVPAFGFKQEELLPKIRLEPWLTPPSGKPVNILSGELVNKQDLEAAYRPETVEMLSRNSPWFDSFGNFERTSDGIRWVGENGKVVEYSDIELQQAADYLEQYEDIPRDHLPYIQEAEVVMSGDDTLALALKFVKDNKEEIIAIVVLTVAVVAAAAYFAPAALLGAGTFLLRLARFAPALGVSAKVWAADERFEERSNCYAYRYLVERKPKGQTYKRNEYEIIRYLPWQECGENSDTSHLEGWEEKVREFDNRHRK
ncbi:hypothetical protein LVJ85_05785 [Neisseria sp. Dent CA1/247]|uniref:hypothetical protein n=1 Tax=Neisseria sp. Dent CA1/247 TaxID=2912675 RepID=UPI001FD225A6|nr:hypothetical protein [Neisseria sp. Dent CA1/247]UOO77973.1 hypothetical protein LVJ85_05785 [Neisseria sp. Dent CA1/247]